MSTSPPVQVLDLGLNNLTSLMRAIRGTEVASVRIVTNGDELRKTGLVVLPGVGAFGAAMSSLQARGFEQAIRSHIEAGGYLMGICLGMQLLFNESSESPGCNGLGLIQGDVHRIPSYPGLRVPHVGWTNLQGLPSPFPSLQSKDDFYFVHSYEAAPKFDTAVIARAHYGTKLLVSAVLNEQVVGFQFHPEKSSKPGARLLSEVMRWARA